MDPETIVITADTRFVISARGGDIDPRSVHGFYAYDTRFLSALQVNLQGQPLVLTGSGHLDHSTASFYLVNSVLPGFAHGSVSVVRDRYVGIGLHEDIHLANHSSHAQSVHIDITFDADFADIFEVRRGEFEKSGTVTQESRDGFDLCFLYRRGEFERRTVVSLTGEPLLQGTTASFDVTLEPGGHWKTCIEVLPVTDEPPAAMPCIESLVGSPFDPAVAYEPAPARPVEPVQSMPLVEVPRLQTQDSDLQAAYDSAIADLRSLRMEYVAGLPILAAGLPWFIAVFGRDSIISAIQTKLLGPELMIGTLKTLAELQATETNAFRDSAPGKIPHEIRVGELSVLGDMPHARYYGTVDATPLFLRLLHEAYLWTGDLELVRSLLPAARAAMGWIQNDADQDGDGFLEYQRLTPSGLRNQGWKDSDDSIAFADGRQAEGAIALAEVQGYAFDAMRSMATLLRLLGEAAEADELERRAETLRQAFVDAFWMPAEGYFAMALDGQKRAVDGIASNPGHLLWSGIVGPEHAAAIVERLMAPDMFSGWGIRTLSTRMVLYDPLSYHNGSVWPHENSLIAAGMARYGFYKEAERVAAGLVEAASRFPDYRLPELFAGYPRRANAFPVPYPAANIPQAWACGAVVYLLEALVGLRVRDGKLEREGSQGAGLRLNGVPFRGMHLEL